ncbi:MAG TPA: translation initiation factor IF-2 [Vicinamibacterales bacterium]|nr:translation initiation factor IF-2 [Vicinamibacterales bacterium]
MATVRIYKVAELLNTSSQEVVTLLKRDHGIEVKSASSTIEEVVARQFVDRLARQRNITLPTGDIFAEAPAVKGKRGPVSKKTVEAAKPAIVHTLPPPRLVKTAKVAHAAPAVEEAMPAAEAPVAVEMFEAPAAPELPIEEPAVAATPTEQAAMPEPAVEPEAEEVEEPVASEAIAIEEPGEAPESAVPPAAATRAGRLVPPQLRLRVEEAGRKPAAPLTPRLTAPAARPPLPRPAVPAVPAGRQARPAAPGAPAGAPGAPARPAPPRPAYPSYQQPPPGGPRPLPSQPVRTQPAGPARPAVGPARPGARPPFGRPSAPRRPGGSRPAARMPSAPTPAIAPPPITKAITLAEGMTVKDLADKLDVRVKDVLKKLLDRHLMMTINSTVDEETATSVAREFGATVEMRSFEQELLQADTEEANPADLVPRAPVVTVMGHVDHGKTTLLDAIRETRVAEREAGGITQHIGAYHVQVNKRNVVFLDTPGHEAFTLMRARGAKVTDVVVLVVAADDGVMPQTREAIDHARAANVPIVVAVNKIDKPDANPERVKRELSDLGLMPEEWGGQTVVVDVSAKKRQNLDLLLEMILLVSDIGELKANPKRNASGTVLEAKLDRGRGPVATILVQDGTLRVGDTFIAGPVVGRVRALIDDRGRHVKLAEPSTPVEVLGLTGLPQPGDAFQALADAQKARQIATFRQTQAKERALGAKGGRLTLESLQQQIAEGGMKELPIIIKADVQGSAEVLADTLTKLSDERVKLRIIHAGVGAINESDVLLASASNAIVIGFNVRPDRNAADVADREKVDIRLHSVIYNVTEEMKKAMTGLLEPTLKEVRLGAAEVRDIFKVPKVGVIAGCMVTDGRIGRGGDTHVRLLRDNVVVHEGKIASLRRFKDDVSEVKAGFECGIGLERFNDVKVGDIIEAFAVERVAATV